MGRHASLMSFNELAFATHRNSTKTAKRQRCDV
jgi:hypothetical protein